MSNTKNTENLAMIAFFLFYPQQCHFVWPDFGLATFLALDDIDRNFFDGFLLLQNKVYEVHVDNFLLQYYRETSDRRVGQTDFRGRLSPGINFSVNPTERKGGLHPTMSWADACGGIRDSNKGTPQKEMEKEGQ